jgi:hypothetical protein
MTDSPQTPVLLKAGDFIRSDRLGLVEIVCIHTFGTVDVRIPSTNSYFRISGLAMHTTPCPPAIRSNGVEDNVACETCDGTANIDRNLLTRAAPTG